jgi:hypothetical protein
MDRKLWALHTVIKMEPIMKKYCADDNDEHMVIYDMEGLSSDNPPTRLFHFSSHANNEVVFNYKDVFKMLLGSNIVSCVFAHNHPNNSGKFSKQDEEFIREIGLIGSYFGIVCDHIVFNNAFTEAQFFDHEKMDTNFFKLFVKNAPYIQEISAQISTYMYDKPIRSFRRNEDSAWEEAT